MLKLAQLGRLILLPSTVLFIFGCSSHSLYRDEVVIDSVLWITIHTQCGDVRARAKVDTGADGSSIDSDFANKFCINEPYLADTKNTKCENGLVFVPPNECRPRVIFRFTAGGQYVEQRATLSNKKNDRYPILIGNRETLGRFVIRPVYETTTTNWLLDDYEIEAEEREN